MSELSMQELEVQHGEVLPDREALSIVIGSIIAQANSAANVSVLSAFVAQANVQTNFVG